MKRSLYFIGALGVCFIVWSPVAHAQQIKADTGGVAIGGNVSGSTINIGIPPEQLSALVQSADLSETQKKLIANLESQLDINQRQIHAALDILGENNVAPENLAAKLVEIAERFKALQATASTLPGDDPKVAALKADAQKAIDAGELAKADALLADVETQQRHSLESLAVNVADTSARRGEIALTRLRYNEAAGHFANAAAVLPSGNAYEDKRIGYLESEADALYRQGDEFGDNGALLSVLGRWKRLAELKPRERVPLDWAKTQTNLGIALRTLGERESGTAKLEEAVAAYRDALKEFTRERAPLAWAIRVAFAIALGS
jgi:tetratricopeptide (TPR) repeat protein